MCDAVDSCKNRNYVPPVCAAHVVVPLQSPRSQTNSDICLLSTIVYDWASAGCGIAVVQEPLHSRLSMEGGNIPIAAALHPNSPSGNLRKACAALMSEPCVDSCEA